MRKQKQAQKKLKVEKLTVRRLEEVTGGGVVGGRSGGGTSYRIYRPWTSNCTTPSPY